MNDPRYFVEKIEREVLSGKYKLTWKNGSDELYFIMVLEYNKDVFIDGIIDKHYTLEQLHEMQKEHGAKVKICELYKNLKTEIK